MRGKSLVIVIILGAVLLAAAVCLIAFLPRTTRIASGPPEPGKPLSLRRLAGFSKGNFKKILGLAAVFDEPISIECGADLYRLEYWTSAPGGETAKASGLIALPRAESPWKGTVSYQHGTGLERKDVPSKPSMNEGVLGALVFAGGGYLFLAPDYLGLGVSRMLHPYLHARSEASAVIDLLKATKRAFDLGALPGDFPSNVFLTGFSQGGHASAASHRALEAMGEGEFQVEADAIVAGPLLLVSGGSPEPEGEILSFRNALYGELDSHIFYIAYLVNSYCAYYGKAPGSLLGEGWAEKVSVYFDGSHGQAWVDRLIAYGPGKGYKAPRDARDMFRPEFIAEYEAYLSGKGRAPWLVERLAENSVVDWVPKAPVRLYYGEEDRDVPPAESVAAAIALGANAQAINLGEYIHEASLIEAVPKIRNWFDEISGSRVPDPSF